MGKKEIYRLTEHYKFINYPLPYAYNALEPYIDEKTMRLHHDKHLQTYIDNLNNVLKDHPELQKLSLEQLLVNINRLPETVQTPILNNAGGVYNHRFYFSNLINSNLKHPIGALAANINRAFGSFDSFQKQFTEAGLSVFGSGYAWLVTDRNGMLRIITTPNQNTPLPQNLCPILNLDVWEHAYYLKHYNVRADYIKDWFQVVNWNKANKNYLFCVGR